MGAHVEIFGIKYNALDYSVREEATPTSLDDTAQSVGEFSVTISAPEQWVSVTLRNLDIPSETQSYTPIPEMADVVHDPTTVQVSEVTVSDPPTQYRIYRALRITNIAPSGGAVFYFPKSMRPLSHTYPENTLYAWNTGVIRGSGRLRRYFSQFPPESPGVIADDTWSTLSSSWMTGSGVQFDNRQVRLYRYLQPPIWELEKPGDYVDILLLSGGGVPGASGGESDQSAIGFKAFSTFSWLGPANDSPPTRELLLKVNNPSEGGALPETRYESVSGIHGLRGAPIRLTDTDKGFTTGVISDVNLNGDGTVTVTAVSDLNNLNSYNLVVGPSNLEDYGIFKGTLKEAVQYYAGRAGANYIYVDPEVAEKPVDYPGWEGESWYYLKQLATVHGCEISFVSGYPVFRPIRGRVIEPGRWISRSVTVSEADNKALSVEVYSNNARAGRAKYVISPGQGEVLSAAPGETKEWIFDLPASIYRITSTEASAITEEGRPVSTGSLLVEINPKNTRQLIVKFSPPSTAKTSQVYLARLVKGERVSTFGVSGDGSFLRPEKFTFATGASLSETATEVGATVESPFITNDSTANRMGLQIAAKMSSARFTLRGTITNVNRRGDSGIPFSVSYTLADSELTAELGPGKTYAQVQSYAEGLPNGPDYASFQSQFAMPNSTDFRFQEFGNVAGSRVWDEETRRWYRITSATMARDHIEFSAEDDLTLGEAIQPWISAGLTYGDIQNKSQNGIYGLYDSPFGTATYETKHLQGVAIV